jgi:hypothetical protein
VPGKSKKEVKMKRQSLDRSMIAGIFKEALAFVDIKLTDAERERLDMVKRENPRHSEQKKKAREDRRRYKARRNK